MHRPHFRLRTLLLAVVVIALVLGGGVLVRRACDYRRLAVFHEQMERRQARAVRGIENLARAAIDPKDAAAARGRDAAHEARIGRA